MICLSSFPTNIQSLSDKKEFYDGRIASKGKHTVGDEYRKAQLKLPNTMGICAGKAQLSRQVVSSKDKGEIIEELHTSHY